jgi:glycosyltransferase involved in cell wall biosynthesis
LLTGPSSGPTITIAVCTWNRARLVEQTLHSLTQLEVPPGLNWEVVVINNNSPDNTAAVLESFVSKLPLRHFLETNQGIAFARNRAALEARGDVVLWTDDDVRVKPHWLAGYVDAFAKHPECGFFGGPVELSFEGNPPAWLLEGLDSIGGALGQVRVPGDVPIGEGAQLPFNCNMAVLREHHLAMPYDTRYGRKATSLMSGEETVFLRELLSQGVRGRWLPEVGVLHAVPVERQSVAYLRKALTGVGRELGLRSPTRSKLEFRGIPLWLWRQALTFEARFRLRKLASASSDWHSDLAGAAISWGRIQQMLQNRRDDSGLSGQTRESARS